MRYRYGFNGKENDKDAGAGVQDYGMRISDNRLARFLSEDPITDEYPELTPYQFASNRPIDGIDLDGLEFVKISPSAVIKRLTILKNNPELIDQREGGTCGAAALAFIWAKYNFKSFSEQVKSLLTKGTAKDQRTLCQTVSPNKDLQNVDPSNPDHPYLNSFKVKNKDSKNPNSNPELLDWMITSSITDISNRYEKYTGLKTDIKGQGAKNINLERGFKILLGYKDVVTKVSGDKGFTNGLESINSIDSKFKEGYHIIISAHAKMFDASFSGQEAFHAVVYNGNLKIGKDGNLSFDVVTWGGSKSLVMTPNEFKTNFTSVIYAKK